MRYAVIMAGGTGTRFWPESREALPKQLLRIAGDKTLIERTVERIAPLAPVERLVIVTGDVIAAKMAAAVPDLPPENLLSEPLRRNTAPCVTLAAKILHDRDPEAVVAVLAADHLIRDEDLFRRIMQAAMEVAAREDVLITLGITPTYAETGYGYIQMGEACGEQNDAPYHRVQAFFEKPDQETAQRYLDDGRFLWNSGMFIFRADTLLRAAEQHMPEMYALINRVDGARDGAEIKRRIDEIYPQLEAVSLDKGIMEKADNLLVFAADIGWSDVGSWTSMRDFIVPDEAGNIAQGHNVCLEASNNTIYARQGLVVAIGVDDLIIVHTPDATLVARHDDAQAIKKIFDELEKRGLDKFM